MSHFPTPVIGIGFWKSTSPLASTVCARNRARAVTALGSWDGILGLMTLSQICICMADALSGANRSTEVSVCPLK